MLAPWLSSSLRGVSKHKSPRSQQTHAHLTQPKQPPWWNTRGGAGGVARAYELTRRDGRGANWRAKGEHHLFRVRLAAGRAEEAGNEGC